MGKSNRKVELFRRYRANLELLAQTKYFDSAALQDIVVCPICTRPFQEHQLKPSKENHLTIEHVPPRKLGGKVEVFTCFECNNRFSHIDRELHYHSQEQDVREFAAKLVVDERKRLTARVKADLQSKPEFQLEFRDDKDLLQAKDIQEKGKLTFEVKDLGKDMAANILKIAYLLAFHKFGYGFILFDEYNDIREQILHPNKNILGTFGEVRMTKDSHVKTGVFLVKKPIELISIMVRFQLVKKNKGISTYSVFLPSPATDVRLFYKQLCDMKARPNFVIAEFPDLDYWLTKKNVFAAITEIRDWSASLKG